MNYQKEHKVAIQTARTVGAYLRRSQRAAKVVRRRSGAEWLDYSTRQDLEAEKIAVRMIRRAFPKDAIVAEETLQEAQPGARVWIVDPLDGTANYANGSPLYGVSVAFYGNGRVRAAAVSLPGLGEEYTSHRGKGVRLNGRKLKNFDGEQVVKQTLIHLGFPHTRTPRVLKRVFVFFRDVVALCADVRRTGSAAVDGCMVAAHRCGAYLTPDIRMWDIAATSLFIEELGGAVTTMEGKPLKLNEEMGRGRPLNVIFAKNKKIHAALVPMTKKYIQRDIYGS